MKTNFSFIFGMITSFLLFMIIDQPVWIEVLILLVIALFHLIFGWLKKSKTTTPGRVNKKNNSGPV